MRSLSLFVFLGCLNLISFSNALKCPRITTQKSVNRFEYNCWDGSGGAFGCCATGGACWKTTLGGFLCDCESRCLGWAVDLAYSSNYQFKEVKSSLDTDDNIYLVYGKDDQCVRGRNADARELGLSARVNGDSCVKFWEKDGCVGKSVTVTGGTISDIRTEGISGIAAVSGCDYTSPRSKEVKLYQHSFWSLFGAAETFVVNPGECKFVGEWWNDKASMIQPLNDDCYKIWEHRDCTGASYCDCGKYEFALRAVKMRGDTSWNNQVSALSLCNYSS